MNVRNAYQNCQHLIYTGYHKGQKQACVVGITVQYKNSTKRCKGLGSS